MADYQLTQSGAEVQAILNTVYGKAFDYQVFNSLSDVGLSSGATLSAVGNAMPSDSIMILDASVMGERPTQYSTILIVKHGSALTRMAIIAVGKADGAMWMCSSDDIASPIWRRIAVGGTNLPEGLFINGHKVPSIFKKTYTGTTSSTGYLATDLGNGTYVPFMGRSNGTDHVVEFSTGSSVWYMHIIKNNANVASTSVSVDVYYFDYNTNNP